MKNDSYFDNFAGFRILINKIPQILSANHLYDFPVSSLLVALFTNIVPPMWYFHPWTFNVNLESENSQSMT